jgi:2,3-bisphosphoglycerate-dependent phosphoglycerate mutase
LEDIPDQQIFDLNIPTGVPLIEELDDDLKSRRHYYLQDALLPPVSTSTVVN